MGLKEAEGVCEGVRTQLRMTKDISGAKIISDSSSDRYSEVRNAGTYSSSCGCEETKCLSSPLFLE